MIKKEFVIKEIESGKYDQCWIYDSQGQNQLAFWEGSPTEITSKIEDFYTFCESGRYKVKLQNSKNVGNELRSETNKPRILPISITGTTASERSYDAPPIQNSDQYREKYEQLRYDMLKLEMERKFELQQDEAANATNTLLLQIFQSISKSPGSVQKLAGTAPAPAPLPETSSDTKEILTKLQEWKEVDDDFYNALCGLVELAKTNPGLYSMAKSKIIPTDGEE